MTKLRSRRPVRLNPAWPVSGDEGTLGPLVVGECKSFDDFTGPIAAVVVEYDAVVLADTVG